MKRHRARHPAEKMQPEARHFPSSWGARDIGEINRTLGICMERSSMSRASEARDIGKINRKRRRIRRASHLGSLPEKIKQTYLTNF